MKTTLNLDDALVRRAKRHALEHDTSLTRVIENSLRAYLRPKEARHRPFKLRLLIKKGRLRPHVRLDDRDSLYDLMEGRL